MTLRRINQERALLYLQILKVRELQKEAVADILSNEYENLRVKEARLLKNLRKLKEG